MNERVERRKNSERVVSASYTKYLTIIIIIVIIIIISYSVTLRLCVSYLSY
jgi:hypothetical protein